MYLHGNQSSQIQKRRVLHPAVRHGRRGCAGDIRSEYPLRETLDRVREFVRNNPTVYCGTHTPQGYENLEAKRVMDLEHPVPTVLAEVDFSAQKATGKFVCSICGYVYDPAEHDGAAFEDLPEDWQCPRCRQGKERFNQA